MKQLQQRVIATYHLGPMDVLETRSYIEHRLHTVGWLGDPSFSEEAFAAIYDFTGGIPRKINTLCDRLLLNGYLEGIHAFGKSEVDVVSRDIQQEFVLPAAETKAKILFNAAQVGLAQSFHANLQNMDDRLSKLERSVTSILAILKQILALSNIKNLTKEKI